MLIISCHADTGFAFHSLMRLDKGLMKGMLDNFVGVYAVMQAYFSGKLNQEYIRIELTYGEETDYAGAYKVLDTLKKDDVVIVIDVTGTSTSKDFVIEKCKNKKLRNFLNKSLDGMSFDIYDNCPDPVSDQDEVDVYTQKSEYCCFLGVPCFGGDYNREKVMCSEKSIFGVADAICKIAENFPKFRKKS